MFVRNLLETGLAEWRKQTALELLRQGKVTFSKATGLAKLSLLEFADLVKQRNVEWVRYTREDIDRVNANVGGEIQVRPLVFNSTTLIYLTKMGLSEDLERLKDERLTSLRVKREVVC